MTIVQMKTMLFSRSNLCEDHRNQKSITLKTIANFEDCEEKKQGEDHSLQQSKIWQESMEK